MAASATFALKAGVWFRRGRLFIVSPDSRGKACPLSGRNSTYRPVQILEAGSDYAVAIGLTLPACLTILDAIGDLLADGCQIEEFLLEGILGLFGKFPIHSRLLPKIVIPVHVTSCLARP